MNVYNDNNESQLLSLLSTDDSENVIFDCSLSSVQVL